MNRRMALKTLGVLAGAATSASLLAGCDAPAPAPAQFDPARVAQGLTTIVVLCMENRSYDHFFGARSLLEGRPGDGLRADMHNARLDGTLVSPYHADATCFPDPPHDWAAAHAQWNAGQNDGFVAAYQRAVGASVAPHVMGYLTRPDLPISYALADSATVCDRWFCSLLGPTWPNRLYLHSGQSGGLKLNTLGNGGFDWPSIYTRLNEAGVPWRYYFSTLPFVPLFKGLGDLSQKVRRLDVDFFDDAAAGTLPPVVFLDPAFDENDDHPPLPTIYGQQLIASIYSALARSPQWPNLLFVITYDEHGGLFDHVPPPAAPDERPDFAQLGFRVPTMVLGPYVKPGAISSVVHDHTSVLAHIARQHGLKPLTQRDAAATDLSDTLDLARLAARDPLPPIRLPQLTIDPAQINQQCGRSLRA